MFNLAHPVPGLLALFGRSYWFLLFVPFIFLLAFSEVTRPPVRFLAPFFFFFSVPSVATNLFARSSRRSALDPVSYRPVAEVRPPPFDPSLLISGCPKCPCHVTPEQQVSHVAMPPPPVELRIVFPAFKIPSTSPPFLSPGPSLPLLV